MNIEGAVVLVTGANRGIGAAFVEQLKRRGASKIYAAARDASTIHADGVEAISLDVTNPDDIAAAAAVATDVDLLINNAGISTGTPLVSGDEAAIRREMDTNFYGPLLLTRAFAPILESNGGGAILNVVSALSWFTAPGAARMPRRKQRRGCSPTAPGWSWPRRARRSRPSTWVWSTPTCRRAWTHPSSHPPSWRMPGSTPSSRASRKYWRTTGQSL